MRRKQEINRAIAVLRNLGDKINFVMAEVLENGLSEQQVFQKYVVETEETDRNEDIFFAARDAARYAAGHLELNELIPGIEFSVVAVPLLQSPSEVMIQVPLQTLQGILTTLKQLEAQVCTLCGISESVSPQIVANDLMEQKEVLEYIGCGSTSLRRWIKRGVVSAPYRRGTLSYFSKQELDNNPVIQRYIERR